LGFPGPNPFDTKHDGLGPGSPGPAQFPARLKMMKMKIKKSDLKRRTMIKGEMPMIKTRKMMRVQNRHT
jgi:hypothetical protein